MKQEFINSVIAQLENFGLNPEDWKLSNFLGAGYLQFENIKDPEMKLLGRYLAGHGLELTLVA